MPGRQHDVIETLAEHFALALADSEDHALRFADGVDDATPCPHGDTDTPRRGAVEQRLQLIVKIIAQRQPRIEDAVADVLRIDAQCNESARPLRTKPVHERLFNRRYSMLAILESSAGSFQPGR